MTQSRKLKIAFALGLVPLLGGLGIFFSWWIGKAWYLTTWHDLELAGFLWLLPSVLMALAGLGFGLAYIVDAKGSAVLKGVAAMICIMINIPALMWVSETQYDIEQRA